MKPPRNSTNKPGTLTAKVRAKLPPKNIPIRPPKKRPRSKLLRQVAAQTDLAPLGSSQQMSNEERIAIIVRRAVYLHGFECKPYWQIAEQIRDEFKLTYTPQLSTICNWMTLGKAESLADIQEMRKQLRLQQFEEIEVLKRRWHSAAMRHLLVERTRTVDGEQTVIVDENAFQEHAKAADVFIKLCDRQVKPLGLDFKEEPDEDGKARSPQEMWLFINQQLNYVDAERLAKGETLGGENERYGLLEMSLD